MMKPWKDRPFEERNLFNPAFCGVLLLRAFKEYETKDDKGMPFSLSLLVLPLCLHTETRNMLCDTSRSYFIKTLEMHPELLVGFARRTQQLLPYTFEALGLSQQHGCFNVSETGNIATLPKTLKSKIEGTEESIKCQAAARIVGRHFGKIANRITVYTTLGIRP